MNRCTMIATAAITLTACASAPAPTYQAAADLGTSGYLTAPAEDGRHTVAYTGEKGMTRAQVAEYALLRAAELTIESGQEWFAVIDTTNQAVQLTSGKDDLQSRSGGGFVSGESAGTGTSAAPSPGGVSDSVTRGGASTGGFGGGDVPYQVIERWKPPTVPQTVIVIQMGKGSQASFEGLDKAPEIFSAKSVAADIRGKMNQ
jgi:hypothetical protein